MAFPDSTKKAPNVFFEIYDDTGAPIAKSASASSTKIVNPPPPADVFIIRWFTPPTENTSPVTSSNPTSVTVEFPLPPSTFGLRASQEDMDYWAEYSSWLSTNTSSTYNAIGGTFNVSNTATDTTFPTALKVYMNPQSTQAAVGTNVATGYSDYYVYEFLIGQPLSSTFYFVGYSEGSSPTSFNPDLPYGGNETSLYRSDGVIRDYNEGYVGGYATFTEGDVIGVAVNAGSTVEFFKNGVHIGSTDSGYDGGSVVCGTIIPVNTYSPNDGLRSLRYINSYEFVYPALQTYNFGPLVLLPGTTSYTLSSEDYDITFNSGGTGISISPVNTEGVFAFEVHIEDANMAVGVSSGPITDPNVPWGGSANYYTYSSDGTITLGSSGTVAVPYEFYTGDVIGVTIEIQPGGYGDTILTFFKNGGIVYQTSLILSFYDVYPLITKLG